MTEKTEDKLYAISYTINDDNDDCLHNSKSVHKQLRQICKRFKELHINTNKYQIGIYDNNNKGFLAKSFDNKYCPTLKQINNSHSNLWQKIQVYYYYPKQLTNF